MHGRRAVSVIVGATAAALLVLSAALSAHVVHAQDPARIAWRSDLAAARAEALESGRPLFVVFRCPP